jgi:hypothetical protein
VVLIGGLGRLAVQEICHSLFQRLGTLGRHFVTEEGDTRCSKNALCRFDKDLVPLMLVEEGTQILLVLFE